MHLSATLRTLQGVIGKSMHWTCLYRIVYYAILIRDLENKRKSFEREKHILKSSPFFQKFTSLPFSLNMKNRPWTSKQQLEIPHSNFF